MRHAEGINNSPSERGWTLTEVLVVTGILVALLIITIVLVGPAYYRAKTQPVCTNNLRQAGMAYAMYMTDNDGLPTVGSIFAVDHNTKAYGLDAVCPLDREHGTYLDMYTTSRFDKPSERESHSFPDGESIPYFDIERDVLVRCLAHGFDGFDRGNHGFGWALTPETKGKVLGVRLSGSVGKVPAMSCWEFGSFSDWSIRNLSGLWRSCDLPAKSR